MTCSSRRRKQRRACTPCVRSGAGASAPPYFHQRWEEHGGWHGSPKHSLWPRVRPHGFRHSSELGRLAEEAAATIGSIAGPAIPLDLTETPDGLFVDLELPGVLAEDLEVSIDGDVLHVQAQRRSLRKESPRPSERRTGSLQRSVRLPFAPQPDRVEARFEHGVLSLFAPKSDTLRGVRVNVASGPGG